MTALIYMKECRSTNDEVHSYLNSGLCDSAGVYTFNQTNGRGQYGNGWNTSVGQNIALTVAIRESAAKTSDSLFNFYTALVIRDFVANLTKAEVKIKWPNDLLIGNRKVCGILIEKRKVGTSLYFLIGVGLNVLQETFENLPKAGSLFTQTGNKYLLPEVAESLYYALLQEAGMVPKEHEVLDLYNRHLYRRNEVAVFRKDNVSQNGIISKADEEGHLWIDLENEGLQRFYHKEIEMLY